MRRIGVAGPITTFDHCHGNMEDKQRPEDPWKDPMLVHSGFNLPGILDMCTVLSQRSRSALVASMESLSFRLQLKTFLRLPSSVLSD